MTILHLPAIAMGFALGLVHTADAQIPAKRSTAFYAAVGDVSDNRTTSRISSRCTLELRFLGDATADAMDVLRVRINKAEDDLKRNLVWTETENPLAHLDSSFKRDPGPLKANITLRSPFRNAVSIKVLEGEVEIFAPTLANGGLIMLKDYFKNPLTPISHPILKRHGLEVFYLTKEIYESRKAKFSRQSAIAHIGWPYSGPAARLYIGNPNHLTLRIDLQNADGVSSPPLFGSQWEDVRAIDIKTAPSAGSQVVIAVMSPETKRVFPFKVENIPLP